MTAPHILYIDGDPYVFDRNSGEYVELHHNRPDHAEAKRAAREWFMAEMAGRVA